MFGDGVAGNRVYSPTEAGNQAIRQRTLERSPWNAEMREIARADYRRLSQHRSELGIAVSSHGGNIQYVGTYLQVSSIWNPAGRWSPMGLEPVRAEAKRTISRGPRRAIGAPSEGIAASPESLPFSPLASGWR